MNQGLLDIADRIGWFMLAPYSTAEPEKSWCLTTDWEDKEIADLCVFGSTPEKAVYSACMKLGIRITVDITQNAGLRLTHWKI